MKPTSFKRFYPIYGASSKNILPYIGCFDLKISIILFKLLLCKGDVK